VVASLTGPQAARESASTGLTATAASMQISLQWQDDANNETGWEVQRSTTGSRGTFTVLATLGANASSYADTGLTPGTLYCYRVRSFRHNGASTMYAAFTNTACATPPLVPPTLVSTTTNGAGTITIIWRSNSPNGSNFLLSRAPSATGPWGTVGATTTG